MVIREEALNNYKNMPPEQFKEHMINDLLAHGVLNAEEVASRIINSAKMLNERKSLQLKLKEINRKIKDL